MAVIDSLKKSCTVVVTLFYFYAAAMWVSAMGSVKAVCLVCLIVCLSVCLCVRTVSRQINIGAFFLG